MNMNGADTLGTMVHVFKITADFINYKYINSSNRVQICLLQLFYRASVINDLKFFKKICKVHVV